MADEPPSDDAVDAYLAGFTFEQQAVTYPTAEEVFATIKALQATCPPPPEPIRATRCQMELLKAALPKASEPKPWEVLPRMTGVPVHLVEDVKESTPWLREWAAPYCEVPFPVVWPDGFGPFAC